MITKDMTLADVVKAYPNTIGFLNGLHLDYCCGGHDPIATAVREKGLDVDEFLAELNQAAARKAAQRDVHGDIEAFKTLAVTEMLARLSARRMLSWNSSLTTSSSISSRKTPSPSRNTPNRSEYKENHLPQGLINIFGTGDFF